MAKRGKPKFPVEPIGSFKYSDVYGKSEAGSVYRDRDTIKYECICDCKGFGDDKPFSVYKEKGDGVKDPFCVTFFWKNDNYKNVKVRVHGRTEERMDDDTYYMFAVLERHATLSAAQKAMRGFATQAAEKLGKAPDTRGELCHNKIGPGLDIPVRVGDLVLYECSNFVGEGIVWQVTGEIRRHDHWYLKIRPVFSATRSFDDREDKVLEKGCWYLRPCDLVTLANGYARFAHFINDAKKRLSGS